jgi:hypothetical protein
MKALYTLLYLAMAVGAGYAGSHLHSRVLKVFSFWTAFSFLLVAGAYALNRPCPFMRMRRGRPNFIGYLTFWPFFLLSTILHILRRIIISRLPPYHEIVPGLYLGRRLSAREAARLPFKPAGVVDLMCEMPETPPLRHRETYASLPVLDGMPPSLEQLQAGAAWVAQRLATGPVYVHCALGHSRGAVLAAAVLLALRRADTAETAVHMVSDRRPKVWVSGGQLKVLRQFAATISAGGDSGRGAKSAAATEG